MRLANTKIRLKEKEKELITEILKKVWSIPISINSRIIIMWCQFFIILIVTNKIPTAKNSKMLKKLE
jgi:hypothetical protein